MLQIHTNKNLQQLGHLSVVVCCSVLKCVAACCDVLQCVAMRGNALQCVALYYGVAHMHTKKSL